MQPGQQEQSFSGCSPGCCETETPSGEHSNFFAQHWQLCFFCDASSPSTDACATAHRRGHARRLAMRQIVSKKCCIKEAYAAEPASTRDFRAGHLKQTKHKQTNAHSRQTEPTAQVLSAPPLCLGFNGGVQLVIAGEEIATIKHGSNPMCPYSNREVCPVKNTSCVLR